MKIAIVTLNLEIGGTQTASIDLANCFQEEGHEVHLISFEDKSCLLTPNKKVILHQFKIFNKLKKDAKMFPLLIFAKICNIFIRKSFFFFYSFMVSIVFKHDLEKIEQKYGYFDLIILRGQSVFELLNYIKEERYLQVVENMNLKKPTTFIEKRRFKLTYENKYIVTVSEAIKLQLEKELYTQKVKYKSLIRIYNLLDTKKIIDLSNEYVPAIKEKYILGIGRLVKVKNFELLLKSYAYLKKNFNFNKKLVIIGDGSLKKYLHKLCIDLNIEQDVYFTGALSNPYPWIKQADLYVNTSLSEGLGLTLLEALSCHTKVVSTKSVGGIREIMQDDLVNYLCDFSEKELAIKIIDTLAENKSWPFDYYLENFSPSEIIKQYIKCIAIK